MASKMSVSSDERVFLRVGSFNVRSPLSSEEFAPTKFLSRSASSVKRAQSSIVQTSALIRKHLTLEGTRSSPFKAAARLARVPSPKRAFDSAVEAISKTLRSDSDSDVFGSKSDSFELTVRAVARRGGGGVAGGALPQTPGGLRPKGELLPDPRHCWPLDCYC